MAFLYAVIGIILLFSANEKCRLEYVVIAYGIAAVAMASFIIALPEKASAAAGWIGRRNSFTIRLMAVVYLAIASLLVYSA